MKGRRGDPVKGRRGDVQPGIVLGSLRLPIPASAFHPLSFHSSFAPASGDVVAKGEEFLQSRLDQERRRDSAQKPERRFVVYFIPQNRAICVGHNQVPVSPPAKGPFDLHVLKHSRGIVRCMFSDPADLPWTKDIGLNDRP